MREIKVTSQSHLTRLDKFLAVALTKLSRSQIKKLILQGLVLVNGKKITPNYQVRLDDFVSIEEPPGKTLEIHAEDIKLKIVYEDDSVVVIDKNEGLVVHPTLERQSGTLVNALLYHFKKLPKDDFRPGIVHRLDKDTSGLMVIAKNQEALANLKKQFKQRTVVKKYLALVSRKLEPVVGTIDKPIARNRINRQKFTTVESGAAGSGTNDIIRSREALSDYKVLEYPGSYTLVEVEPKTGRTHQIRVHLASIGHPVVGDTLYGGKKALRMFLHAAFLEFTHPKTGKRISFESPLPKKLEEVLEKAREGK